MRKHSSENTKNKVQASKNFAEIGVAGVARGERIESLNGTETLARQPRCVARTALLILTRHDVAFEA